jgi:hypothetical protein
LDKKQFAFFDRIHAEEELKTKTKEYLYTEIQRRRQTRIRKIRYSAAAALVALFLCCSGFSYKIYFTPDAYIDMDVNPSIGLTLNRFEKVITASAYNEDGAEILSLVNVRFCDYNKAVGILLDAMEQEGYFSEKGQVSLTVQTGNGDKEDEVLANLQKTIEDSEENHHSSIEADVFAVSAEVKECADHESISPAKYLAIQELMEVDENASFESCRDHSISELQELKEEHCNSRDAKENEEASHDAEEVEEESHDAEEKTEESHHGENHHHQK